MKSILLAICLISSSALAGGISFEDRYIGTNPLTGRALTIEHQQNKATDYKHIMTIIDDNRRTNSNLKLMQESRTELETIFNLLETTSNGDVKVAQIITSGDCQSVQRAFLKLNSGVMILLHPEQN